MLRARRRAACFWRRRQHSADDGGAQVIIGERREVGSRDAATGSIHTFSWSAGRRVKRNPARRPRRADLLSYRAAVAAVCTGSVSRLKLIVLIFASRPWITAAVRSLVMLPPTTELRSTSSPQFFVL